jgi:hypothetical protein
VKTSKQRLTPCSCQTHQHKSSARVQTAATSHPDASKFAFLATRVATVRTQSCLSRIALTTQCCSTQTRTALSVRRFHAGHRFRLQKWRCLCSVAAHNRNFPQKRKRGPFQCHLDAATGHNHRAAALLHCVLLPLSSQRPLKPRHFTSHNGSRQAFDVKYIRFAAVGSSPPYVTAVSPATRSTEI